MGINLVSKPQSRPDANDNCEAYSLIYAANLIVLSDKVNDKVSSKVLWSFHKSYGQKLISLFVRLLFSGESYSLTELARMLDCSNQSLRREIGDASQNEIALSKKHPE